MLSDGSASNAARARKQLSRSRGVPITLSARGRCCPRCRLSETCAVCDERDRGFPEADIRLFQLTERLSEVQAA
ncbi:MAG: hypothetical protein AAFX40_11840 [Cyanobacteria bacterium J06639_1]